MNLRQLLQNLFLKTIIGKDNIEISGLEIDSRKVKQGDLFICLPGHTVDGHDYASDAVNRGAIAVLAEKDLILPPEVTTIQVPDTRRAMAVLADTFYGSPSQALKVIGVTGTNGKTTVSHLIEQILNHNGKNAGLIGTLYIRYGDYTDKSVNTTPEALYLQRYLKQMADQDTEYAVLEVSSHALEMGRMRGCRVNTGVFTNLSHDHLDYHESMDRYRGAKELLFTQLGNAYGPQPQIAVLNADDSASKYFAERTAAQIITYGIDNKADVMASDIDYRPAGTSMTVETFQGSFPLTLRIPGDFNVYNALAAVAACLAEKIPLGDIKRGLESFEGVKGRFEVVYSGPITVIVDYAHNPDGLEKALKTARKITRGRLFSIFGSRGGRDKQKRPLMARIAVEQADFAIFTTDSPGPEDPHTILQDMLTNLDAEQYRDRYATIADRREAIDYALQKAQPSDCIIITGRGHETHQLVEGEEVPFDDREVILELLKKRYL